MFIKNYKYEILTDDGFSHFDGIQCVLRDEYISILFESGNNIKVSIDHKFFNKYNNEIKAINLNDKFSIKGINGIDKVKEIERINSINTRLYDPINVKKNYRYYSNGILSHNCLFLGSSSTVIDADILRSIQDIWVEPLLYDLDECLRVYEKPIPGAVYVIGNDVAKGTGLNYSVCQILKIVSTNPLKLEQVAVYQNNFVDVYNFSTIINKLCYYYNNAWLMVENNSDGAAVVNQLWWTYENENLVNSGSKSVDLGIRATTTTKPKAVLFMKKLVEGGDLIIRDQRTISELNDFIDKGNNRYGANNYNDDLVSGLYWALYLFQMDLVDDVDFMSKKADNEEDDSWGILSDIECDTTDDFYVVM